MNIENLIKKKRRTKQCFIKADNIIGVAIIEFFDKDNTIGEVLDYINEELVVFTQKGNIEYLPFSYIDKMLMVLDEYDEYEFNKHYKDEIELNPISFMFETVNLYEIMKGESDIYECQKKYKKEFEKLFRKFCGIKDKRPIWLKDEK